MSMLQSLMFCDVLLLQRAEAKDERNMKILQPWRFYFECATPITAEAHGYVVWTMKQFFRPPLLPLGVWFVQTFVFGL